MINDRELALYNPQRYGELTPEVISGNYILMGPAPTYAKALHRLGHKANFPHPALRLPDGRTVYRPLSFAENLRARIEEFNTITCNGYRRTEGERFQLFDRELSSSCGIAYKRRSSKCKVIPVCQELITVESTFDESSIDLDYASLSGVELDSSKPGQKYNTPLTPGEVLENEGWIIAVEEDHALLREYRDIVVAARMRYAMSDVGIMAFFVPDTARNNEVRNLLINKISLGSSAVATLPLDWESSFLRRVPSDTVGIIP